MSEEQEQSMHFLVCQTCGGSGYLGNDSCKECHEMGTVGYLDNYVLYWGREISDGALAERKLKKVVGILLAIVLALIALSGVACVFYEAYLGNFSTFLTWSFWGGERSGFIIYFWFTACIDMYLFYSSKRKKELRVPVIKRTYETLQSPTPPSISWQQILALPRNKKIDISQSFSDNAFEAINRAFTLAQKYKSTDVGVPHLLSALIIVSNGTQALFSRLAVDTDALVEKMGRAMARYPQAESTTVFSSQSKTMLIKAYKEAYLERVKFVDSLDILEAIVIDDEDMLDVLLDLGINEQTIRNAIRWFRINDLLRKQYQQYKASAGFRSKSGIDRAMTAVATPYLNQFSDDLTLLAKMGYLNICVGRDREFDSLFRIFEGAATKGVIIVGQPGVGKSAIIDGLAQKMVGDDVPAILKEKRLVSLSISRLVAGASASEAQERMMIAINEIVRARNIILVVDNVHDIMGISAGGEQSLDLSEVLAEAISKNLLILIGTTDDMNYSRYVERTTLGGILQKIELDEVDINGAIQVLESKVGGIENQNGVFFSYGALEAAAKLTDRYVNDRFLPSKAIKLIEEVAVYVKNSKGQQQVVTREDVAKLLSEKINIPVSDITTDESAKLLNLESILHGRVIGQDEAVKAVSTSLRRARTELRESNRPIANLLFLGPTGVGKTELTKAIAHEYFGSEDRMVRIDMSEYQEQSSISKLIGAPPGAGGAATLGQLTEAVRKNPFSIVLLDEMEKAHPDILNLFLQVMEDGRLTDATGNTIDFTNAIVIATSNAGSQYIQDQVNAGTDIETIKQGLLQEQLKDYFRPEFINRFDNVIVFKPLQIDEIRQIARLMLNKVAKQLEEKGIHFRTSDEAVAELAQVGFDPQFGARPLRRAVQDTVDNALAEYLLQGKISRRDIAVLEPGGKISIEKAEEL